MRQTRFTSKKKKFPPRVDFNVPRHPFIPRLFHTIGLTAITLLAGCQERPVDPNRFIPKADEARRAVSEALTARRENLTPEQISKSGSKARLIDNQHKAGQSLKAFAILGEVAADKARGFAVRLTLENPEEEQQARYLVYGVDPIWVFRQEDFDLITHWEHAMGDNETVAPSATAEAKAPTDPPTNKAQDSPRPEDHHGTPRNEPTPKP